MDLQSIYPQQSTTKNYTSTQPQELQDEPFWGRDGFNLLDVIDMVNPLQHLPVISKYYRKMTGDDCSEGSKLVGDVGFGVLLSGAIGAASAVANSTIRQETHQDVSEHLMDFANESYHSLTGSSDNSVDKLQLTEAITQKNILPKEHINPFFAQLFDDDSNQSDSGKDWGRV